ncbi:MAG TPA: sensor histidine kinase [Vicinamibacterales bacterium]|nr:sensor histidine kinase [Vicinamibacterales bacterium]
MLSLRARIFIGAVFWMAALFIAAGMLLTHLMARNAAAPGVFHRIFLHMEVLGVVIVICLGVGLVLVRRGLSSFDVLRERLSRIRDGRERRLEGEYPKEVIPLINDLNGLLDDRDRRVTRALTKAGDLAHGLKTPLAILNQHAARARAAGQVELAQAITQQVERMRRQVDYHLAQARASASGANSGARSHVMTSADALARTMMTLHAGRGLQVDVGAPHDHFVRVQREDLEEMLGNLVDNACKWARSQVRIHSRANDGMVEIWVDDDGPGLEPALREKVLQRGVRVDEAAPGSGLGLAIVTDLVELYGGSLELTESPQRGLRAELRLPAA